MYRKIIMALLTVIMINGTVMAQQKPSLKDLMGVWNIFSMDVPGEMYFNFKTDSVSIKSEAGEDSSMIAFKKTMIIESLKGQAEKMSFAFDDKGNMFEGTDAGNASKKMGQYDAAKGVALIKENESAESKEIRFVLKNNELSMLTEENGVTVTIMSTKKTLSVH